MEKTVGELVDELSIANVKIALLVERLEGPAGTLEDARKVQTLNRYRSLLKNALDERFGERLEVKT